MEFPDRIEDIHHLEQLLSEPTAAAIDAMHRLEGDILILGAGGKMGPSFARLVRRATDLAERPRRVIAVSRFQRHDVADPLRRHRVEVVQGDLMDDAFIAQLPMCDNVVFMAGSKFGTSTEPSSTWGVNVYLPTVVCRRFPKSRILAFSTGNVYPLVSVDGGGSVESDRLAPVGEYAMSALGRERMFDFFSRRNNTPMTLVRLNYAVEMRYGVLVDLARQVLSGQPVDVSMGHANVIWQADANAMACAALADAECPPFVINVAGPERLNVAAVCGEFAHRFGTSWRATGTPASTALLSNAARAHARYGLPRVPLERLIDWTADWLLRGQSTWNKPTMFQVRDGQF